MFRAFFLLDESTFLLLFLSQAGGLSSSQFQGLADLASAELFCSHSSVYTRHLEEIDGFLSSLFSKLFLSFFVLPRPLSSEPSASTQLEE